jgi:1,4-dihydroxy-2-naphthoate octaprenyltransferase
MTSINIIKIIRLHIVVGGILAFLVGTLIAITQACTVELTKIVLAYGVVFFGDLSTHFSNDYFDFEIDKHKKTRKHFSGRKILVSRPDLRKKAKNISQILLITSILLALSAVIFFNAPILLLVIAVIVDLLGWFYSAPPIRLSKRGLGEATVAFATGFAIPSIAYLSVRYQLDTFFLFLTIPFMLYGFILSLNLEAPDIKTDKKQGKTNLATKTNPQTITYITAILAAVSTTAFLIYKYTFAISSIDLGVLTILSTIPLILSLLAIIKVVYKRDTNTSSTLNIYSLIVFNFLTILYLLLTIFYAT